MTPQSRTSPHLTEDEIDEHLMGIGSPDRSLHLAGCDVCQQQVEQFNSSMAMFNQASQSWSEAKSNSLDRDLSGHRLPFRLTTRVLWSCVSVLVLMVAGLVAVNVHPDAAVQTANNAAPTMQSPASETVRETEIASDNAMLRDMDAEINAPEPSPEDLYRTDGAASRNAHRDPARD